MADAVPHQIPSKILEVLYTRGYQHKNNCTEQSKDKNRRVIPEAFKFPFVVTIFVTINQYFLISWAQCDGELYKSQEWGTASCAF